MLGMKGPLRSAYNHANPCPGTGCCVEANAGRNSAVDSAKKVVICFYQISTLIECTVLPSGCHTNCCKPSGSQQKFILLVLEARNAEPGVCQQDCASSEGSVGGSAFPPTSDGSRHRVAVAVQSNLPADSWPFLMPVFSFVT